MFRSAFFRARYWAAFHFAGPGIEFGPIDPLFTWTSTDEPLHYRSTDKPLEWV